MDREFNYRSVPTKRTYNCNLQFPKRISHGDGGKKMKHAKLLLLAFLFMFFIGSATVTDYSTTASDEILADIPFNGKMMPSYTTHGVIQILNDTDFMWQAGNESWVGDGSEETPYVIEGYNITTDVSVSLEIRDVTAYFEIRDCLFRSTTHENVGGVVLFNVTHGHLEGCFIINKNTGLEIDHCIGLTVTNCTMDNNAAAVTVNHSNHTSFFECYFINTTTGSGIYQDDAYWTTVDSSCITDNNDYGVESYYSDYFTVIDSNVSGNGYAGFLIENSHNGLYEGNSVFDNGEEGFVMSVTNSVTMIQNMIYDNGEEGIYFSEPQYGVFSYNTIYNNTYDGIDFDTGSDCVLEANNVFGNGWTKFDLGATGDGILIEYTDNCSVIGNTVYNNSMHGIELGGSTNAIIHDNTVYGNFGVEGECGISVGDSDFCNITSNVVYNNTENGIYIYQSDDCIVSHNIVYENSFNGIYLSSCNRTLLFYNDLGWNPTNALDIASPTRENYWDNGIVGNWWSDYNGTGTYNITGSAGSVDMYPSLSLYAGDVADEVCELGSTGNTMVLEAQALNPWYYEVYDNLTLIATEDWNGEDIIADINGFDVGVYSITIRAYHVSGHSVYGVAQLTVEDTTPPDWVTQPEDQTLYYGQALSYQVSATDFSGIGDWTVNDTRFVIVDGLITNGTVLTYGDYGLRIGVSDIYDNERSFDIRVRVLPEPTVPTTSITITSETMSTTSTTTPVSSGGPDVLMIALLAGVGGVAVIIVIVFIMKRKGA